MNITTDQIQKYLEENKQLILAILENKNKGKLSECAQYEEQLQRNLTFLAAIADAQPQTPSVSPQARIFPPVAPFWFNLQQQVQEEEQQQQQQQQQQLHYQPQVLPLNMAMRPITMSGMPTMHAKPTSNQETGGATSQASADSQSCSGGKAGWGSRLNLPE